jgi:hypothetical protein
MNEDSAAIRSADTNARLGAIEGQIGYVIAHTRDVKDELAGIREILQKITLIEERSTNNADATGRAFKEIKELRDALDSQSDNLTGLMLDNTGYINWVKGALALGVVLFGLAGWVVKTNIDPLMEIPMQVQRVADKLDETDRREREMEVYLRTLSDRIKAQEANEHVIPKN